MFEQITTNLIVNTASGTVETVITKAFPMAGMTGFQLQVSSPYLSLVAAATQTSYFDVHVQGCNDNENWLYYGGTSGFSGTSPGTGAGLVKDSVTGTTTSVGPRDYQSLLGANGVAGFNVPFRAAYVRFVIVATPSAAGTISGGLRLSINSTP